MKNRQNVLLAITVIIALLAGFLFGQVFMDKQEFSPASSNHALLLETPRKLAIPALQQDNGERFDMASLEGKWSLLFFGFTNCPDVCPATLNTVAQAKKKHEQAHNTQFPQVIFISVDPQRDNVKLLGDYVRYFDKDFIGATGEEKLLRAITVQTYANFMTQPSENENEYQVGHSLNLVLINPNVEMVAVLSPPHSVENILEVLKQFQM